MHPNRAKRSDNRVGRAVFGPAAVAFCLLASAGCNNGRQLQADLYQRELRLQEDEIYRLEDNVGEYQELIREYRCEVADLKRRLAQPGSPRQAPTLAPASQTSPSGELGPTMAGEVVDTQSDPPVRSHLRERLTEQAEGRRGPSLGAAGLGGAAGSPKPRKTPPRNPTPASPVSKGMPEIEIPATESAKPTPRPATTPSPEPDAFAAPDPERGADSGQRKPTDAPSFDPSQLDLAPFEDLPAPTLPKAAPTPIPREAPRQLPVPPNAGEAPPFTPAAAWSHHPAPNPAVMKGSPLPPLPFSAAHEALPLFGGEGPRANRETEGTLFDTGDAIRLVVTPGPTPGVATVRLGGLSRFDGEASVLLTEEQPGERPTRVARWDYTADEVAAARAAAGDGSLPLVLSLPGETPRAKPLGVWVRLTPADGSPRQTVRGLVRL